MPITNKDSILKQYYEANGQQEMFGRDNLQFKTVNHPTRHRFDNLCPEFKLKKFIKHSTHSYTPVLKLTSLDFYKPWLSLTGDRVLLSVFSV